MWSGRFDDRCCSACAAYGQGWRNSEVRVLESSQLAIILQREPTEASP